MTGRASQAGSTRAKKQAAPFPPTTAQNYWQPRSVSHIFDKETFRATAYRKDRPNLILDPLMDQFNWQRTGASPRTGTVDFYRPLGLQEAEIIAQADQIGIDVSLSGPQGPWFGLLRMAVSNPQESVVAGTVNLNLETVYIATIIKSKRDWRYGKDAQHPRGWSARQITLDVCKQVGCPIGPIPASNTYLPSIVDKASSGYDVIIKAWQADRKITGRRYIIDDPVGALQVTEVLPTAPKYVLPLGPAIAEAVLSSFGGKNFYSAVLVHGHSVKTTLRTTTSPVKHKTHYHFSHTKPPIQALVEDQDRIARYGYLQKSIVAPKDLTTTAELRKYGLQFLARQAAPQPSIEVTHPGVPWVDVGTAAMLDIPDLQFHNLVYAQSVSHSVGAGQYVMDVTWAHKDPWLSDASATTSANKRARGLHTVSGSHNLSKSARPVTTRSKVHSGSHHH